MQSVAENHDALPVEWRVEPGLTGYPEAVAAMETRVAAIRAGKAPELVWLVEHPPLYRSEEHTSELQSR